MVSARAMTGDRRAVWRARPCPSFVAGMLLFTLATVGGSTCIRASRLTAARVWHAMMWYLISSSLTLSV
eukprot:2600858-Pyramimonas_sp.AAC.1